MNFRRMNKFEWCGEPKGRRLRRRPGTSVVCIGTAAVLFVDDGTMGRGGACCASDADNGDEGRVDDLDEDTKAKAQEKLDKDNEYEPSGSGRIPGSKHTISEEDVLGGVDTCGLETWREVA
jgi:hypothetical protein